MKIHINEAAGPDYNQSDYDEAIINPSSHKNDDGLPALRHGLVTSSASCSTSSGDRQAELLSSLLAPPKFTDVERFGALALVANSVISKEKILRCLSALLGMEISRILRFEGRHSFYVVETKDGQQIHVPSKDLFSQSNFRRLFLDHCGKIVQDFDRKSWLRLIQILTNVSDTVEGDPELTVDGSLRLQIDEYFREFHVNMASKVGSMTKIENKHPFIKGDYRLLFLSHFHEWLAKTSWQRITQDELSLRLEGSGWERKTMRVHGHTNPRSVYRTLFNENENLDENR